METMKGSIEKSKSVRDMHHLRLMSLLQELERDHGRKKTAELLVVDRRTLNAALDDGVLSRRIRGQLEKALQYGLGSAAAEQRDRNDKLEDRLSDVEGLVEKQGEETQALRRALEDGDRAVREEVAQALRGMERTLAERNTADGSDDEATQGEPGPRRKSTLRREYPDLVTIDPAPDDEEVFGDAWPLIVEWRELKATHPNEGRGPGWLTVEERLMTVELALLEEHGLTLPPARFPLRGFDRNGQVKWRRTALSDTRRALRKWRPLQWAQRVWNRVKRKWAGRRS